jgi:hypothetical protein
VKRNWNRKVFLKKKMEGSYIVERFAADASTYRQTDLTLRQFSQYGLVSSLVQSNRQADWTDE